MSKYKVIESEIKEQQDIIEALQSIGIPIGAIEIHETPVSLRGYRGDTRAQKANIIIRQETVNRYLSGGSSNDIGFELRDGKYHYIVSDYDMSWWRKKEGIFWQSAAASNCIREAKRAGYTVKKVEEKGVIKLYATALY